MTTQKKYEVLSREWIQELRRQLHDALAGHDLEGIDYSLSEEYFNVPPRLRRKGASRVGFHFRIGGGAIEVVDEPADDTTVRIRVDYEEVRPYVLMTHAELFDKTGLGPHELLKQQVEEGLVEVHGDLTAAPAAIVEAGLHDRMASVSC
jgi:hypothetical protein